MCPKIIDYSIVTTILKNSSKPYVMNTNVSGYWDKKKEKLKQKFPLITDDDLSYGEGKEKEMIELLGYKLGKSKQELLYIIVGI
jgi:uncharacterized protein YjbJ (UPF0337 family)